MLKPHNYFQQYKAPLDFKIKKGIKGIACVKIDNKVKALLPDVPKFH